MKPEFAFPDLGEFQFVSEMLAEAESLPCETPNRRSWIHAGDDAAQFDGWLVTKDLSVEGTHFRLDWSSVEQAVEKNIVSNVSDISAMGGTPKLALLGICLNKSWEPALKKRVAKAFREGLSKRGIVLLGGDTVAGETGMFSLTLLGLPSATVLCRKNAQIQDKIYVTGTLGKSAAGLWILLNHPEEKKRFSRLVEYHLSPKIVENAGIELVRLGVKGACMDISDGLSSELNHLASSSGVLFEVCAEKLPIDPEVVEMSHYFDLNPLDFALNGGEEYQLLFTSSLEETIFSINESIPVTCIGRVLSGAGVELRTGTEKRNLAAGAFTHL